jgi:hypothetical protein
VHAWTGPNYGESPETSRDVDAAFELLKGFEAVTEATIALQEASEDDWLQTCFDIADPDSPKAENPEQRARADLVERVRSLAQSDQQSSKFCRVVTAVSRLPYFSKVWILQETGRAKRLTFSYNGQHLPHRQVFLASCLALFLCGSMQNTVNDETLPPFDTRFLSCLTARLTYKQKRTFRDVLTMAFYEPPPLHQATDPQDLIFARLGLVDDRTGITARYSKRKLDASSVFTEATTLLLQNGFLASLTAFKPRSRNEDPEVVLDQDQDPPGDVTTQDLPS